MAQKSFRGKTSTIKLVGDASGVIKKTEEVVDITKKNTKDVSLAIMPDVVSTIARFTPPSIGKNSIQKRFYTRPILYLPQLVRGKIDGHRANAADYVQLRSGMLYKIVYTKRGVKRHQAFAYSKSINQAKKLAKIQNRGMARVMWGKTLGDINVNTPNTILRLMRKSPNMTSLSLSKTYIQTKNDLANIEITIENKSQNISNYGKDALRQGYKKFHNMYIRRMKEKISDTVTKN